MKKRNKIGIGFASSLLIIGLVGCDTSMKNVLTDAPYTTRDHRAPHQHEEKMPTSSRDAIQQHPTVKQRDESGADTSSQTMPKTESSQRTIIKKTNQGSGPHVPDMAPVVGQ